MNSLQSEMWSIAIAMQLFSEAIREIARQEKAPLAEEMAERLAGEFILRTLCMTDGVR